MPAKHPKPRHSAPTGGEPHATGSEASEFARRMDRAEKSTRMLCVIGALGSLVAARGFVFSPSWLPFCG